MPARMISGLQQAAEGQGGIALGLVLGLLVGVQRGWAQRDAVDGSRFAGVRTFGLLGLAGALAGHLTAEVQGVAMLIMAAAAALILLSYHRASREGATISGTASLVGLITLASGFLAGTGERLTATGVTVVMVLLLTMRERLHAFVERMTEVEVAALARFALIAGVVLPLLPDEALGPLDAWNPRNLWLVVVLVCGISLAGYVAARMLGPSKGVLATAAAGSMVSSTAVTVAMASRMKEDGANLGLLGGSIAIGSVVMFARMLVLTGLLAPFALPTLALLAAPGLAVSLAGSGLLLARLKDWGDAGTGPMVLRNPFAIGPALILMALVMAMSLVARWLEGIYGDAGLATVLAIAGIVDADSAVITLGGLPEGSIGPTMAGLVLLPPIVLNSLFKAGTAISIAGRLAWPAAGVLALSAIASLAVVPFVVQWPA